MAVAKRILLMILAVAGVALAIAVSGPASAAPIPAYTTGAAITVSNVDPEGCSTITVSGTGFRANEKVALTQHSAVYQLKTVTADRNGAFTKQQVTLVAVPGNSHFIQAKGLTSGKLATANITIQHPQCRGVDAAATSAANNGGSNVGGASTSSNGGGGLSSTGVAVVGLGVIALGLIVAGSIFTFSGRRAVA